MASSSGPYQQPVNPRTYAAIPRLKSPSTFSKGYDATNIFIHEMVETSGEYAAKLWDKQLDDVNQYKLEDLLLHDGLSVPDTLNALSFGVEHAAQEYLRKVLDIGSSDFQERHSVRCSSNQKVYGLPSLYPFSTSLTILPDAFVEVKVQKESEEVQLWVPILAVKVFSNKYDETLAKLTVLLIDQLRLLRHVNVDISKCTGFVFPRQKERSLVTEIVVQWKRGRPFCFDVELIAHKKEDVRTRVRAIASEMFLKVQNQTLRRIKYFMPLSPTDLECFGPGYEQVPSRSSILVCNEEYYCKLMWDTKSRSHIMQILAAVDTPGVLTPVMLPQFFRTKIVAFKRLPYSPLTVNEAKQCSGDFVHQVHLAVKSLHDNLGFAHLDVRLENVCFNHQFHPMLIDLDRMEEENLRAAPYQANYSGVMYTKPSDLGYATWKLRHSDWKQFGLMCWWIVMVGGFNYHEFNGEIDDEFIKKLYKKGEYDEHLFLCSKVREGTDSLETILSLRDRNQPAN